MTERGIAGLLADRLSWRHLDGTFESETDRGWVARILAVLFGFGGVLLLSTLLLEGASGRDSESLAIVAFASVGVAIFILLLSERLPVWFLRAAPGIGTLLVSLTIYYAGAEASAAYAMSMAWVVIAAALFLDTRLILAHGVLSIANGADRFALLGAADGALYEAKALGRNRAVASSQSVPPRSGAVAG